MKVIVRSCNSTSTSTSNSEAGHVIYKGLWNPSGGTLPGIGKQGWQYKASADGTVNGFFISQGSFIQFLVDNPGQTVSNYDIR